MPAADMQQVADDVADECVARELQMSAAAAAAAAVVAMLRTISGVNRKHK